MFVPCLVKKYYYRLLFVGKIISTAIDYFQEIEEGRC